ncbi:tetratricopeptide repeat-containing diguanylate cyclase [Anaerosporobacter faecicola]|uniref:tetratricopeptide repeat-containing diguanylate cyclase n=1 Tax=Anaerosporobacter faecicola TaxID=2718714 RepID=UPI001439689A|nr:GGDEF domain-containing protein [Anaerosporobacter faecicola]
MRKKENENAEQVNVQQTKMKQTKQKLLKLQKKKQRRLSHHKMLVLLIGVVLVSTVLGMIFYLQYRGEKPLISKEENKAIRMIEDLSLHNISADMDYIKQITGTIRQKDEDTWNAEEYFLLAVESYMDYKDAEAKDLFLAAISHIEEKTDGFVKVATGFYLSNLEDCQLDEILEQMNQIFPTLRVNDWNENIDVILSYTYVVMNEAAGREVCISYFEDILKEEKKLSVSTILNVKNNLGVMYSASGNYAKGLEQSLSVIALAQEKNNAYFEAKASADLSAIYNALENYEKAEEASYSAMEVKIDDPMEAVFIKSYAIGNLCQAVFAVGDYEKGIALREELESLYPDLPEEESYGYRVSMEVFEAEYYVKNGEFDRAKECIINAEEYLDQATSSSTLNTRLLYLLAYGDYLAATGQSQEALGKFKEALENADSDAYYKKIILSKMVDLTTAEHASDEAIKYYEAINQIYDDESSRLNNDYADYCIQKYNNERENIRINEEKIRRRIYWSSIISVLMILLIGILMKLKNLQRTNKMDSLTQCYNRNYFEQIYAKHKKEQNTMNLIMFDIDNFKKINDTYGHMKGDEVLRQLGAIARKIVGKQGQVFRYGGEEFVVILTKTSLHGAEVFAERIRDNVEHFKWKDIGKVTISVGVASNSNEEREEELLLLADECLYCSKEKGKNQVTINGYA